MNYKEYSLSLWNNELQAYSKEWQVIQCFYASLHATNYFCGYKNGAAPTSHTKHQKNLEQKSFTFMTEYEQLRQLSEEARYRPDMHPMSQDKIDLAHRLATVILKYINIIE